MWHALSQRAYQPTVWRQSTKLFFSSPQIFFFNRHHRSVCTFLIPDLMWLLTVLHQFVLCMTSSCAFVAGQCYNKGMAWKRLLAYLALCFCLQKELYPVGVFFLRTTPFVWPIPALCLCWLSNIKVSFRLCSEMWDFCFLSRPGPPAPNRSSSHRPGSRSPVWPSIALPTSPMWLSRLWKHLMAPPNRVTSGGW